LLDLLRACAEPAPRDLQLAEVAPVWSAGAACCVVAASSGYPGAFERGLPIDLGMEPPRPGVPASGAGGPQETHAIVFHAGTARVDGRLVTAGGRVLGVTGLGPDAASAREAAYRRLDRVSFPGMHVRRDIGLAEARAAAPAAPARA
jgi:phosphoribosylamine--glycine ligase